jgi:Protein of unknown function (DUF1549)/Protein of unknown function (DUF1553)
MTMRRIFSALLIAFAALAGLDSPVQADAPPQIQMINDSIKAVWTDFEIRPSGTADDATWCRRVHLDLIGRIPTITELDAFLTSKSKTKRVDLVQLLLHDDRYTEEYANHWSTVWTNLMIGRSGGDDQRSMVNRDGMQKYFRDSFARNKPYDKMVEELVTATGSTKPGTPDFNGATNFLIDKVNEEEATLATSSVSRIFLGQQVQCTQCHDHPFNQWKQQKFWEFNAFLRQTRGLRRFDEGTNDVAYGELVDEDFAGDARDPSDALIYYEKRNGRLEAAYPVFTDDTPIEVSGYVSDVNRRQELARLMLASEFLDKMAVNRVWSWLMGYGFTRPIDDLGPHNPSTHPELLESLAAEFRKSSYDLKELLFWIALSTPYQLEAELSEHNKIDDPTVGETPKFSRFYVRQMSAEQLYQSMMTATGAKGSGSYEDQERQRRMWMQQFVVAFGTDEGDEATNFDGSIPQVLMMFNGELTRNATTDKTGGFIDSLSAIGRKPEDRVHELFRTGLSRRASVKELKVASKIGAAVGEKAMLQDMWWAILNSNEFILQH